MNHLARIYRHSLGLLTDLYELTMAFDDERSAFQAYANALPNNCVFLVDTYDTLRGVQRAAEVGDWLRQHGHQMVGVRLDSGDLEMVDMESGETRRIPADAESEDLLVPVFDKGECVY